MGSAMSDSESTLFDRKMLAGDDCSPKIRTLPVFDHPTADVVLRSSDGMDFRVHKIILSLASPIFQTMFTLPVPDHQPPADPNIEGKGQMPANGIPVIAMAETSTTLEMLLAFCYPMANPSLASADLYKLKALMVAVEKFDMDDFVSVVDDALIAFAARDAVAVYAVGCQLRRARVIKAAATYTLQDQLMANWSSELNAVPCEKYYRLLDYHRQCSKAAAGLALTDWRWIESVANIPLAKPMQECKCTTQVTYNSELTGSTQSSYTTNKNKYMLYVPNWWWNYMKSAEAALKETPCSAVVTGDELLGPTLTKVIDCNNKPCRTGVREAMVQFSQRFAQQVDKVINEVPMPNSYWD